MNTETVRALLTDFGRFAETALHLQWAETKVTHIEQADITHLCCTEEFAADHYAHLNAQKRMQHLEMFASDYIRKPEEFGRSLGCWTPEIFADELQRHRGESDFAAQFLPLFERENEMIYIGMHGCTPCRDYITVSGDTILMTSLSVCC